MTLLHESFAMIPQEGPIPRGNASSTRANRPWILRFARVPDRCHEQTTQIPDTVYDYERQISVALYGDVLPYMATNKPTVQDGSVTNPPKLDEGAKD
jgi:hypothetical protein